MAVRAFVKPEAVRYRGATCTSRDERPEKAAQTYQTGAFTFVNTSGELEQADGVTPGNITAIWGVDSLPASGITGQLRNVEPITPDMQLIMSITHSTPASAVTSESLVTSQFAIKIETDANGNEFWVVDISNTTDKIVQIQKIAPRHPLGDQHGAVYVNVLQSFLQYHP